MKKPVKLVAGAARPVVQAECSSSVAQKATHKESGSEQDSGSDKRTQSEKDPSSEACAGSREKVERVEQKIMTSSSETCENEDKQTTSED